MLRRNVLPHLVWGGVFGVCALPVLWLTYAAWSNQLGANPAEALIRGLGDWSLRLLCVVLALTPLRVTLSWTALARLRRMLGLWVFFYVTLHLLAYAWLDMGMDFSDIARDIGKRPFILAGFSAGLVLSVLAATSFKRAIQVLGASRWKLVHRGVYGAALLALLHFFWMRAGKNDVREVWVYATVIALLLGWRVWYRYRDRRQGAG